MFEVLSCLAGEHDWRLAMLAGVVCLSASLAIGFAPDDTALVAGRAVQGVGAAFMMPTPVLCKYGTRSASMVFCSV